MDKRRRQKIKENILKLHNIGEQMFYYDDILNELNSEFADLHSELYQDRPKEYIEDVLVTAKEMQEKDKEQEFDPMLYDLIFVVREWLQDYHCFIDERISRSEGKQLRMLTGEIE